MYLKKTKRRDTITLQASEPGSVTAVYRGMQVRFLRESVTVRWGVSLRSQNTCPDSIKYAVSYKDPLKPDEVQACVFTRSLFFFVRSS